jgi:hypothetical protein
MRGANWNELDNQRRDHGFSYQAHNPVSNVEKVIHVNPGNRPHGRGEAPAPLNPSPPLHPIPLQKSVKTWVQ